jgi:hypothetical protein
MGPGISGEPEIDLEGAADRQLNQSNKGGEIIQLNKMFTSQLYREEVYNDFLHLMNAL